jgi:hypothetical protein
VEAGVAFVEVYLANWDSHFRDVATQTRTLMSQVDSAMSSLVSDLHERGLLNSTLVIWMGEFGRTPQVNTTGGRDHYAKAWSSVMFGGGSAGKRSARPTPGCGPSGHRRGRLHGCRVIAADLGHRFLRRSKLAQWPAGPLATGEKLIQEPFEVRRRGANSISATGVIARRWMGRPPQEKASVDRQPFRPTRIFCPLPAGWRTESLRRRGCVVAASNIRP